MQNINRDQKDKKEVNEKQDEKYEKKRRKTEMKFSRIQINTERRG